MKRFATILWTSVPFFFLCFSPLVAASHPPVKAKHGMVVADDPLAAQIGVDILKKGGNAIDAAVAVGFALAVTYPEAGNIGGGGFMTIRLANGTTTTIDFREEAPMAATKNMYRDSSGKFISGETTTGCLAAGVPGSVAGLLFALEKFGTMKRSTVIGPAVRIAKKGFTVREKFADKMKRSFQKFSQFPSTIQIFSRHGKPLAEGTVLKQRDLARTLQRIIDKGRDGFYKGKTAALIVAEMKHERGIINHDDLEEYRPVLRKPIEGTYRGYQIISMGPPSSGGITLVQILNIVEGYNLRKYGWNSSKTVHILAEAMRRAYADRAAFLGDPSFSAIPVEWLLSKKYAEQCRQSIDLAHATPSALVSHGTPPPEESHHTTHYSVIDKKGNCVSVTTTLNGLFGCNVVVKGAGFLLNNEMGDFSRRSPFPSSDTIVNADINSIAPRKRMMSSMTPTIILKNGKPFMILGSRGSSRIITQVLEVFLNVVDFDMNIQEAVDAPRFYQQWLPDVITAERHGLVADVVEKLRAMGHKVVLKGSSGYVEAILVDQKSGWIYGAADPRGYGQAIGY
jgi:gamma-glutamyltranspeptidase / glutathione hydrolase